MKKTILGPPGCGKTHTNSKLVKEFIEKGIDINSTNINEGPREGWSIQRYATEINNEELLNFVNEELLNFVNE